MVIGIDTSNSILSLRKKSMSNLGMTSRYSALPKFFVQNSIFFNPNRGYGDQWRLYVNKNEIINSLSFCLAGFSLAAVVFLSVLYARFVLQAAPQFSSVNDQKCLIGQPIREQPTLHLEEPLKVLQWHM